MVETMRQQIFVDDNGSPTAGTQTENSLMPSNSTTSNQIGNQNTNPPSGASGDSAMGKQTSNSNSTKASVDSNNKKPSWDNSTWDGMGSSWDDTSRSRDNTWDDETEIGWGTTDNTASRSWDDLAGNSQTIGEERYVLNSEQTLQKNENRTSSLSGGRDTSREEMNPEAYDSSFATGIQEHLTMNMAAMALFLLIAAVCGIWSYKLKLDSKKELFVLNDLQ